MSRLGRILKRPAVIVLVAALLYAVALGTSSLDIGRHWDEGNIQWSVQKSAETGLLVPNWYLYPSLPYDISVVVAAPSIAKQALADRGAFKSVGDAAIRRGEIARTKPYLLRLRAVFFILSMIAGVAVFVLALALTGNSWLALFSALLLILSPEFFYHSRWVATDTLLAMLTAWAMFLQYRLFNAKTKREFVQRTLVTGAFVGLCIGTKYPGGILLAPLALAVWLPERGEAIGTRLKLQTFAGALLAAAVVFLLTTPGAMVDPLRFARDVVIEIQHYSGGHGGYTVGRGWDHFSRLATYLSAEAFSEQLPFALGALALSVLGGVHVVRQQRRLGVWLLSLPVLFLAYMTQQRVMIVRNDMLLLPMFAVLAGLGVQWLLAATRDRVWARGAVVVALVALVGLNVYAVTDSSLKTRNGNPTLRASALAQRLAAKPEAAYLLSPGAAALLESGGRAPKGRIVQSLGEADRFVFLSDEVAEADWRLWPANSRGRYVTLWSRGEEINWDYYPTWFGSHRLLEVSADDPAMAGLVEYVTATR